MAAGDEVRRGDVLVRFEMPAAVADVEKQQAELARAEAALENAKAAQSRARELFERGVAARKEVEDANRSLAEPLFDTPMGSVLISEVVQHEHDLLAALGVSGDLDSVAVRAALTKPLQQLDQRMRENDVPALRIPLEHGDRVLGHGEPAGTLRTTSFELMRAIGGRRSVDQIKALDWDGDPDIWIAALALFGRHRPEPFCE